MKSSTFRVVTQGLLPDYTVALASRLVATLFKCSDAQVAALVGDTPVTAKKGLTHAAAEKYAQALARCGCAAVIEEEPVRVPALTLSDERLLRLQPKLFDMARWASADDRDSWRIAIHDTLARGDCRAAVVVDAENSVVASYSSELDCVVLLQFAEGLGLVHGWQNGTRLLSAMAYFPRDQGLAPDVRPGPGDTGRWGNLWPLVADLLTDDHAALAARKSLIDKDEWDRTGKLGRSALADAIPARDGRPLGSRHPARTQGMAAPADTSPAHSSPAAASPAAASPANTSPADPSPADTSASAPSAGWQFWRAR